MTKISNNSFFGNFSAKTDEQLDNEPEKTTKTITGTEELEVADTDDDSDINRMQYDDDNSLQDTEKEEKEVTPKEDPKDEDEELEEDPFIATINHLAEKGLISYDEDKEYEEEGEELLEVVFQETLDKRFQEQFVDTIPEEYQSIFKHLQAGKPLEDWVEAIKPTDFDSINMEDESNQKQLVEDHLALTGMDDEDIKDRLQELEDLGTLEKAAKTAVKYLKKNEESRVKAYEAELEQEIKTQKKREADDLEDFKRTVLSTEELKGFKLANKKEREALFDYITKPANNKGESKYVQDTKAVDSQLALAYMSMKGFSFKDLQKAVETKVTSGLRKSLSRITDTNAKGTGGSTRRESLESTKLPSSGPWATRVEIED